MSPVPIIPASSVTVLAPARERIAPVDPLQSWSGVVVFVVLLAVLAGHVWWVSRGGRH